MIYIASSLRLPIVLSLVNRAVSGPLNIHNDHSDAMGVRDAGWIMLFSENCQEAYDNTIMANRIAEHESVQLPLMVCQDGFITSHSIENIELIEDDKVKEFVGKYQPEHYLLNKKEPIAVGPLDLQAYLFEHKFQQAEAMRNAKQVIEDAEETGMKFGIVCGYNRQIAPINENLNTSDMVVDTKYASGGATCADYLTAFDDWGNSYSQKNPDGHYHVSWDYKIDASTCAFPEQTWFIKNLQHVAYGTYEDDGTCDIVMWLLSMKKQHTVFTDKENYPQFSLYNTYKRFTKGINVDTCLGDVNHDYMIKTDDARLALKMAAGLVDIPEDEDKKIIIDANEDGEISTDDARYILCWAAGISTDELY
jgi:hypothetical protein